jgi:hypothetical protein
MNVKLHTFLSLILCAGERSASCSSPYTSMEKSPNTYWIGGRVGPKASLDMVVPNRKIPSPVANQTQAIQPEVSHFTHNSCVIQTVCKDVHTLKFSNRNCISRDLLVSGSKVNQNQSELVCNRQLVSQSVSQSVSLGIEPLWDIWQDFGCSQDSCGFVCYGASWQEDRSAF